MLKILLIFNEVCVLDNFRIMQNAIPQSRDHIN